MIPHIFQTSFFLFHHHPSTLNQKLPFQPLTPFPFVLKAPTFLCSKHTHVNFSSSSSSSSSDVKSLKPAKRIPRPVKTEAQRVLMDYLHLTRGYTFLDAEYISKNCPHFIESLASKVVVVLGHEGDDDDDDGVAYSLRKYLRYNPINEFEPFLESLGIRPSELHLFLPRGMFFLDDDSALIDNFHVLCNYGVPRNVMGKIYKEAKEVFRYPKGLLSSKFQGCEDLGLSKSLIIKLVVCCPSILVGDADVNGEFMNVLDWLRRIGIEDDWIVNYMSYSRTYSWGRMLDSIQFLDEVGFSEEQMHNLFKANPKLLLEGFGKKLHLFLVKSHELGLKVDVIYNYFMEYPHMLSSKFSKNLLRVVEFLCFVGMGTDDIVQILSNHMHLFSLHSLKSPRTFCLELKVEKGELCRIIYDDPLKLISMASRSEQKSPEQTSGHDPHKHLEKINFLMKLGYAQNSEEMAKALKRFRGRGDQLQERFDCLVEAGLDYNSVIGMIKSTPMILNQRKDVIEKKIDFVRNILGYPLECVVRFPSYFCYDLEKIIQRFSMYAWLKERKAINPSLTLSTIVSANDKRFVKYFVNIHPQGPIIWENIKRLSSKDKN